MASNRGETSKNRDVSNRNILIVKIALFLNYISKATFNTILKDLSSQENNLDIFKFMVEKKYIPLKDCISLKKTCVSFTKMQKDSRFGSLCLEFDFLTESNLKLALEEQQNLEKTGKKVMIGDLLVEAGMISDKQKKLILQKQKLNIRPKINQNKKNKNEKAKPPGKGEKKEESEGIGIDTDNFREIREQDFIFFVQNDSLTCYVVKADTCQDNIGIEEFKDALERNGLIYGVVDDEQIKTFLNSDVYKKKAFHLATGLPPIDGTDARIKYHFDTEYLKAGQLKEDGTIDFKERGEIPFVQVGYLLAEKKALKEGKDGVNVFGDAVSHIPPADISLNIGKGVRLSEDEFTVYAEVDGNPKLKPGGEISVNDAYYIDGDVDYNTGHVKFDKNVFITGSIRSGFRVEAIDVVADSIDGGFIEAQGDVLIKNGVVESQIKAKGNITSTFMHRSKVSCLGDLNIIKEVVDTQASTDGAFNLAEGKLFSSTIYAKGGAKIKEIGSERSKSSAITIGASYYLENELTRIDKEIEHKQNTLEQKTDEKTKLKAELDTINDKLENLLKSAKRTQVMIDELKAKDDEKVSDSIISFKGSIKEAEKQIKELTSRKEMSARKVKKLEMEEKKYSETVKYAIKEKFELKKLNQDTPPKPILDVTGSIFAGSRINGRYTKTIINENLNYVRIVELSISPEESQKKDWEMIIRNL